MSRLFWSTIFLFCAGTASAGGFHSGSQSARAMGLGGAFVAMAHDASSTYANPAAVSFLEGSHLSIGATIMVPLNKFALAAAPGDDHKMESVVLFPPHLSLTHTFPSGLGLGVAVSVPYIATNEWGPGWFAGRAGTRSELRVLYVSPAISLRLVPSLSVGFSLNAAFSRLQLERRIGLEAVGQPDAIESIEGSGKTTYGFQAGLYFHPDSVWSIGASYRRGTAIPFDDGRVTFNGIPEALRGDFSPGGVATSITTPDHLSAGFGCRPADWLYVAADVEYALWSSLSTLSLRFADGALRTNPQVAQSIPLRWKNSLAARGGIEITVGGIGLRAGYSYEQSPVPGAYLQPWLPDADRGGFSGGIGYPVSDQLQLDFACSYIQFKKRAVGNSMIEYLPGTPLNGTYNSSLTMVSINMSYSWE